MIYDVQKANVLKRASGFLLDIILIAVLAVGFMALLSLICDYDGHYNSYKNEIESAQNTVIEKYKNERGINLGITKEEYEQLGEEEKTAFDECAKLANEYMKKILLASDTYKKESSLVLSLSLMMTSVGIFLAMLVLEFIIPVCFKNGQTIGKKVFGIAVMHTNGVRVRPLSMFVRSILGMYVFEIMVPVLIGLMMFFGTLSVLIGTLVLVAICVLQLAVFISTRNTTRSFLHDLMARTVTVDLASQMIFDSEEEMLEFKKEEQNALAERSNYKEKGGFDFYNSSLNYRKGKKIVDENGKNIENEEQNAPESTSQTASENETVSKTVVLRTDEQISSESATNGDENIKK